MAQCPSCAGTGELQISTRYQERNPNIHEDYVTRESGSEVRKCLKCSGRGTVTDDNNGGQNGGQNGGSGRLDGGRWYG